MLGNTSEASRKRRRVGDDAGSAEDAAPIAASAPSNENHHAPSEVEDDDIKVILSPYGTITEAHLKKTLGSICDSLGGTVYMVDPAELDKILGLPPKNQIENSIRDSHTILLPILTNRNQRQDHEHWVLVVISHDNRMPAPPRLYCASYTQIRIREAKGVTTAFLDKYLADSQSVSGKILQQCACCNATGKNDSAACVFAFGMYAIAQCPMPRQISVDIWRSIVAFLLGFKNDDGARENELFSERRLDENTLRATYGPLRAKKLEKHRDDAEDFIAECSDTLTVLRKIRSQITTTSGGGQSSQHTAEAESAANRSRGTKIRDGLEFTMGFLSGLEAEMEKRRKEILSVLDDLKLGVAAAGV
ncbi:hypothetical protein K4K49_003595 [Colletotrichum sp. SAR 10_70]|nr:hypothetical protein K4K50_002824 [Colletotrichum sp. SAR 10_71]KAI8172232.1 hypothetical protein K4K49_003595 [Colletotrichum sp. SAR 10_70]